MCSLPAHDWEQIETWESNLVWAPASNPDLGCEDAEPGFMLVVSPCIAGVKVRSWHAKPDI